MMNHFLIKCSFFVLLFFGAHSFSHQIVIQEKSFIRQAITQVREVPSFGAIKINGAMDVVLHTGARTSSVVITGDRRDLSQVVTKVQHRTLFLGTARGFSKFGSIKAEIYTQNLAFFHYLGSGTITGSHIVSKNLFLSINNPGITKLSGQMYLVQLNATGPGHIELRGVRGHHLRMVLKGHPSIQLVQTGNISSFDFEGKGHFRMGGINNQFLKVRARDTQLTLSGRVFLLNVALFGRAQFNGRSLKASRAFVQTHDHAIAGITALDRQHTFATDASDIYFYHIPEMQTNLMAWQGSVLDLH